MLNGVKHLMNVSARSLTSAPSGVDLKVHDAQDDRDAIYFSTENLYTQWL